MRNIWLLSPLILSKQVEIVFIFQFLNDKIQNLVKQNTIVNSIIQKLKNKHTFLKKYTNWGKLSSLILTEQEETKTRYFAPKLQVQYRKKEEKERGIIRIVTTQFYEKKLRACA